MSNTTTVQVQSGRKTSVNKQMRYNRLMTDRSPAAGANIRRPAEWYISLPIGRRAKYSQRLRRLLKSHYSKAA